MKELRTEICNYCDKPFSYKAKDFERREYPFTCMPCIMIHICRPALITAHSDSVYKHGGTNHRKKTKLYRLWTSIKDRSYNPNCKTYRFYGGKGLGVCDEWRYDYIAFKKYVEDRGYQEGCSIIRKDKLKGYEPGNIFIKKGKGTAIYHLYKGTYLTLAQLHKLTNNGIKIRGLQKRLIMGWSIEDAITRPLKASKLPSHSKSSAESFPDLHDHNQILQEPNLELCG